MKKLKQVLAIDVGSSSVKLAILEFSGSHISLLKTALKEIPQSAEQNKEEFIKSSIREFLNGYESIKNVCIALSYPYVEIERVDLPHMPIREVSEAAKWKIKDRISFNLDNAIVDSIVTDEYEKEDGSKGLVAITGVADRERLYSIIRILDGLQLNIIEVNAITFGFANILKGIGCEPSPSAKGPGENTCAIVEIGARYTHVSIYKSGKLIFTRNIPVSSYQITDSMCGALVTDKGRIQLSFEEAENIKINYGFPVDQKEVLDGKIPSIHAVSMMRPVLENLALEIKRTFTYYSSELKGSEPSIVYISGGGARLKNLDKFLNSELKIDVKYLSFPENIENRTNEDKESILSFLGLIGAALPFPIGKINLLPPEIAAKKVETIEKISMRMAGFTALCILILLYIGVNMRISSYKKQLESTKSYRSMLEKVISLHNEFVEWGDAISAVKGKVTPLDILLKEISNVVPHNIVLNELNIDLNAKQVVFKGTLHPTSNIIEDELTKFMEVLEKSRFFKEANLGAVDKAIGEARVIVHFEIICVLA